MEADRVMTTPGAPPRCEPLRWTPELVARFWDQWSSAPGLEGQYFTFQVGAEVVSFLGCILPLRDKGVLDYGCGPGFLIEHLLRSGARVIAADYSLLSVKATSERFSGRSGWVKALHIGDGRIEIPDGSLDVITCIETIEHMFDSDLRTMMSEFARVLRPGGFVMFTTPNDEDLTQSAVACPNCNCSFHTMQHIRAWTSGSLREFIEHSGFDVPFCKGVDLRRWATYKAPSILDTSIRELLRGCRDLLLNSYALLADRVSPRPFPNGRMFMRRVPTYRPVHLVAVGVKRGERVDIAIE